MRIGGVGHSGDCGVQAPVGQEAGEGLAGVNDLWGRTRLGRIEDRGRLVESWDVLEVAKLLQMYPQRRPRSK